MELQVEKEQTSPVEYVLKVTVPADTVAERVESAIDTIARKAQIPGFRVGKVPRSVVVSKYGSAVTTETVQELLQEAYRAALEQSALFPVTPGQMSDIQFDKGSPLSFKAKVEVLPEFDLPEMSDISVERLEPEAGDEDVMNALDNLREANGTLLPSESGATEESTITADFQELDAGGVPVIGRVQRDIELDLRRINLGEDFASKVQGIQAGQAFVAEIPIQGGKAEQPKSTRMQITVKTVKERELPPLDDDFARTINPQVESLAALRSDLKKFIEARAAHRARDAMYKQIVEALLRKVEFPVPPRLVEDYLDRATHDAVHHAEHKPGEQEITEFREKHRGSAVWNMRWYLMRNRLVQEEKLDVPKLELDAEIERLAQIEGYPVDEFKDNLSKEQREHVREDILERKVFQYLEEQVTVVPRKLSLAEFEGRTPGRIITP
ncbi:trigger factor [candidate division KSB1 bacterium]|nr:trigger factor [candidate division KSB1 bacterium]